MKKYSIFLILILIFPCTATGASVTLSWTPPVFSCDGSTLDDLAGYVVMWGTRSGGPYPNLHNVDNALATSTVVDVGPVEDQTLYFVMVSVDSSGNRSDDSGGCGTSNQAAITLSAMPPSPPTGLTISVR